MAIDRCKAQAASAHEGGGEEEEEGHCAQQGVGALVAEVKKHTDCKRT